MGGAVAALYLKKIKKILKNPSSKHAKQTIFLLFEMKHNLKKKKNDIIVGTNALQVPVAGIML